MIKPNLFSEMYLCPRFLLPQLKSILTEENVKQIDMINKIEDKTNDNSIINESINEEPQENSSFSTSNENVLDKVDNNTSIEKEKKEKKKRKNPWQKCEICGKKFNGKNLLSEHMTKEHFSKLDSSTPQIKTPLKKAKLDTEVFSTPLKSPINKKKSPKFMLYT